MGDSIVNGSTCENLAASIQRDLNALPVFSINCCIYKVPKLLREVNKQAYTPIAVSIGPLHYNDESLLAMEVHKLKYLRSFLYNSQNHTNLECYLLFVKDNETLVRESYANPTIHISSDEFTRMVLVDSVFIIELFRRYNNHSLIVDDQLFGNPRMINEIVRDMMLVENQLPFFLLLGLYNIAFKPQESIGSPSFTDLACIFLKVKKNILQIDEATNETTCCHLLDFLLSSYKPYVSMIGGGGKLKSELCPTTTALREAGVRFQVAMNDGTLVLSDNNVHFDYNKGILIIPRLEVTDRTESILRNLIAFEQCHYLRMGRTYISDYQCFLDCLINTSEDVQVLVRAGIIENWLGSDKDVSDLINSLGDHILINPDRYHYGGITEQLNRYCDKRWNRYNASLKHTYFKHPWAIISVIYAVILLLLTLIQVVLAIMSLSSVSKKSQRQ